MGKNFLGLDGLKHFWSKAKTWIVEQITTEVTAKIAEIIAEAPENLNTLKEIADWISTHEDSASAMNTAILANKTAISGKADKSHTHTKSQITDFPTSLPANGGTADKTVNDITIDIPYVTESGQYVIPLGNILEPTSTEINSPYNWDITGFFSIIRPSGHAGMHITFAAGHGYSHGFTTYAYLDEDNFTESGSTWMSIKAFQYNGKWWLGLWITAQWQGYTSKMTVTYSRGLPATPTCILYNSQSGGVANEEIYNSIQDIPSSWWKGRTIYNPTTFTQNITAPVIQATTNFIGNLTGNSTTATTAICSTDASVQDKVINLPGLTLTTGMTVNVFFSNGNSAEHPRLKVNSNDAIPIYTNKQGKLNFIVKDWDAGISMTLMFKEDGFVVLGNPIVKLNLVTADSGATRNFIRYASGLLIQWGTVIVNGLTQQTIEAYTAVSSYSLLATPSDGATGWIQGLRHDKKTIKLGIEAVSGGYTDGAVSWLTIGW